MADSSLRSSMYVRSFWLFAKICGNWRFCGSSRPASSLWNQLARTAHHLILLARADFLQMRQFLTIRALERLAVTRHHFIAVRQHGLQRVLIEHRLAGGQTRRRRDLLHLGQTERRHDADVHPADVELVPLVRQLGRRRVRVVIVVQFFTADEDAPREDVGAGVGGVEVAITPPVREAVHHARRPERNPDHLHGPDRQPDDAEQRDVDAPSSG